MNPMKPMCKHLMPTPIDPKSAALMPLSVVALLLNFGVSAWAQDTLPMSDPTPWSFSGYGTLGYSQLQGSDELTFVRDLSQPGSLTPRTSSFKPDSRLAVQAAYRVSAQTDAVVQAVWRQKAQATAGNSIEWAYLSHRPTEDLTVRGGRVGIDVFLLSDYRNLGYAQSTVRPNWDYYGFMPIYSLDGIDATYTHTTDAARWSLKSQWGRAQAVVPIITGQNYDFVAQSFWDVSLQREAGPWRVKAGYATMTIANEAPLAALTDPLKQLAALSVPGVSAQATQLAQSLSFADSQVSYLTMGAAYDDGIWQLQTEISKVRGSSQVLTQGTAAYVTVGRRFGDLLPFASISTFRPPRAAATPEGDWGALLGDASASVLQTAAVSTLNSPRVEQKTVALGLRWDLHPQAALKLQWDHIWIKPGGYGLWSTPTFAPAVANQVNLLTASLDWVF